MDAVLAVLGITVIVVGVLLINSIPAILISIYYNLFDKKEGDVPYKSEKQRRYLHAKHPEIAARWDAEGKGVVVKKKPAARKGKKS